MYPGKPLYTLIQVRYRTDDRHLPPPQGTGVASPLSKVRYRTDDRISDKYHSVNCQLKYAKSRLQENHLHKGGLKNEYAKVYCRSSNI